MTFRFLSFSLKKQGTPLGARLRKDLIYLNKALCRSLSVQGKSFQRTCKGAWRTLKRADAKAYDLVCYVKQRCRQTRLTRIRFTHFFKTYDKCTGFISEMNVF